MEKKIKLRDLTEEQYKKWYRENCYLGESCDGCILKNVECSILGSSWIYHKDIYSDKFLEQEIVIKTEKPQLTYKEKLMLCGILYLEKETITHFEKISDLGPRKNCKLLVHYFGVKCPTIILIPSREPIFEGMELHIKYTLEELGLK